MKFTDRQIKNLKPSDQRYEVFEDRGFGVRVSPTGRKTFIYLYRMRGEVNKRRLSLGTYPAMSLAEAHRLYAEAREMVTQGIDPGAKAVAERKEDRKAPTVANLTTEYLEKWAKPRKRSWLVDKRILEKDVLPDWGRRKAKDITRRDIIRLLDGVAERGGVMANRTLAVIRKMFNFAVSRDIVPTSPCTAVQAPAPENRRDRVLTAEEIKVFWQGLFKTRITEGIRLALKLQLVTAQRKGEVISSAWGDFDLDEGWWTIPAEKAKNGLPHRVPLSAMALDLLQTAKTIAGDSPWVFPSPRGPRHITPTAVDHALRLALKTSEMEHFVPHDLRRTAASHMAGGGTSRLVVSKLLNHVENGVTAVYDRHSYDREKRQALEAWGLKLKAIIEGLETNVIPMVR
ncbi:MAG: tyrosine-type recombinase/integrase [Thermodesulfobacteriota bacterium]